MWRYRYLLRTWGSWFLAWDINDKVITGKDYKKTKRDLEHLLLPSQKTTHERSVDWRWLARWFAKKWAHPSLKSQLWKFTQLYERLPCILEHNLVHVLTIQFSHFPTFKVKEILEVFKKKEVPHYNLSRVGQYYDHVSFAGCTSKYQPKYQATYQPLCLLRVDRVSTNTLGRESDDISAKWHFPVGRVLVDRLTNSQSR